MLDINNQELIRVHMERVPLAIIQWDSEFRVQRWSALAPSMFGWSEAEVLGKHPMGWKFIYEDDLPAADAIISELIAGSSLSNVQRSRVYRKDGSILHTEWFNTVVRGPDGRLSSLVSFVSDVTDRVRAEEKARDSEERYAALSEITSDAVFIHENMVVVDGNSRMVELFGYSKEELIGLTAGQGIAKRDLEKARAAMVAGVETSYEIHLVRKDGLELPVEMTPRTLRLNGKVVRGIAVRDLTEQRAKEAALREGEQRSRAIFESAGVGMVQVDLDGRIQRANDAFAKFIGAPAESLPGRIMGDSVVELDLEKARENRQALLDGRLKTFSVEKRYRRDDGTEVWGSVTASAVRSDGEAKYMIAVIEDITRRKQVEAERDALLAREQHAREEAEALVRQRTAELTSTRDQLIQQERLAMAGQLAAGVAHEVNNPLAFVISSLEYVREELEPVFERLPAETRTELESAMSDARLGTQRIRNIVNELKSFSRQDADDPAMVDVRKAADFSAAMAMPQIRCRAQLVKDYAETPEVWATETRLGQVLLNLMINAAQAIPEGAASSHTITLRTFTSPAGEAVVEVKDTGVGIPQEKLKRIFEPFFTTKPQGQGTGLGLSICLGIVQSLGGRIEVDSEVDVGSTFRIVLPAAKRAANVVPYPNVLRPSPSNAGARVLVVDDEPGITNAVRRLIGNANEVVSVHSGAAALEAVGGGAHYDLILCDLMMPELTGVEVYEALQKVRPDLLSRFVLMTGGAFTDRGTEFLKTGVRQLNKPFNVAQLKAVVSESKRPVSQRPELKLVPKLPARPA